MVNGPSLPDPESGNPFWKALDILEKFEGGYADDPADPGGATLWGVTQSVYDQYRKSQGNPVQPVKDMSDEECTDIYWTFYWRPNCLSLQWPLSLVHFDTVVNMAPVWWRQCLAAAAGSCGLYLDKREDCYRRIVANRPASAKFISGWMMRVQKLRNICANA